MRTHIRALHKQAAQLTGDMIMPQHHITRVNGRVIGVHSWTSGFIPIRKHTSCKHEEMCQDKILAITLRFERMGLLKEASLMLDRLVKEHLA
jgi:hypothetical protein